MILIVLNEVYKVKSCPQESVPLSSKATLMMMTAKKKIKSEKSRRPENRGSSKKVCRSPSRSSYS